MNVNKWILIDILTFFHLLNVFSKDFGSIETSVSSDLDEYRTWVLMTRISSFDR